MPLLIQLLHKFIFYFGLPRLSSFNFKIANYYLTFHTDGFYYTSTVFFALTTFKGIPSSFNCDEKQPKLLFFCYYCFDFTF
jgi:hypothetical protein